MSSDVIARVLTLTKKADELRDKGHMLRAAENYGRAAEAARALGEDNLVLVHAHLQQVNMLAAYAVKAPVDTADPRTLAAHRAACIALLSGAMEMLANRRVAGTLLEGKCAAVEEAWFAGELQQRDALMTSADAARWGPLSGYEQFLGAATYALDMLSNSRLFAAECSAAQFQSFAQHAVHAAELMQQPRRHGGTTMGTEAGLTDALRDTIAADGLDARLAQLLAGAWQRLQRSGVLRARRIEARIGHFAPEQRAFHVAANKSLNAPGLRSCALPGCGVREAHPTHFKSCAACRTVVYCCREHQVVGWPGHKKACKAARKAAAAEEDEAGPSGA